MEHAPCAFEIAPASRERLLRRVSLDLTGLPPTTEEIDAFLADRSGNAYERVVDRLLRSPRYGEHWAVDWLDAARYGDTDGYQVFLTSYAPVALYVARRDPTGFEVAVIPGERGQRRSNERKEAGRP